MIKQIVWDDNQWMGYDDIDTIALKTQWANENCLGGTVAWSIDFNSGPGR
jgi:chitinase